MFLAFVISSPYTETNRTDLYAYTSAIIDSEILFLNFGKNFIIRNSAAHTGVRKNSDNETRPHFAEFPILYSLIRMEEVMPGAEHNGTNQL